MCKLSPKVDMERHWWHYKCHDRKNAEDISEKLVEKNLVKNKDKDVYQYGIEVLISTAINIILLLVIDVVSLKRLLNQSNLKSWSSKMIKKSLEAYFFTLKNKIVFCKNNFKTCPNFVSSVQRLCKEL